MFRYLHGVSTFLAIGFAFFYGVQYVRSANALNEIRPRIEDEEFSRSLEGKTLPDVDILDIQNDTIISLAQAVDSDGITAVIITSISTCSLCREQVLDAWKLLYENHPTLKIKLIVSEGQEADVRLATIQIKNSKVPFKAYIDVNGEILSTFHIEAYHTPITLLVNGRTTKIGLAFQSKEGKEEEETHFQQRFVNLGD